MFVGRGRRVSRTRMSIKHAGVHPDRYFILFAFLYSHVLLKLSISAMAMFI